MKFAIPYTAPVNQLLELGTPQSIEDWSTYLKLGITEADIPKLARMSIDTVGKYVQVQGTSFSSPVVADVVALMKWSTTSWAIVQIIPDGWEPFWPKTSIDG